jgi:hypothetical protein
MAWLMQALGALQDLDWRTLVPAALGAILGGAIATINSFLVARRTSRETLRRDEKARFETRKAAALRAMVKLLIIVNGIETLHRSLEGLASQWVPLRSRTIKNIKILAKSALEYKGEPTRSSSAPTCSSPAAACSLPPWRRCSVAGHHQYCRI